MKAPANQAFKPTAARSRGVSSAKALRGLVQRRIFLKAFFALATLVSTPLLAQTSPLKCSVGPITKIYGNNQWLVYSCNDEKSVVVVSGPNSSAAPFYFIFSPSSGGYQLRGEGTGNKAATDAAYNELHNLSSKDVEALIVEAKKVRPPSSNSHGS